MIKSLLNFFIFIQIFQIPSTWASLQPPSGMTLIRNTNAYIADSSLISSLKKDCLEPPYATKIKPSSQSIETLIDYIERLEDVLANTTDEVLKKIQTPDDVARLILHRFYLDNIDFNIGSPNMVTQTKSDIDTVILGTSKLFDTDYYFPDNIYSQDELCTLLFMFSHFFINNTEQSQTRKTRSVYTFDGGNSMMPRGVYLDPAFPLQEKGVVSFRQNEQEAISPGKLLVGIIAGFTKNPILQAKDIAEKMNKKIDANIATMSFNDHVMATTLGSLAGSAKFLKDAKLYRENLVFGVSGKWVDQTCCNYYAITDSIENVDLLGFSNRGSLAEIRGALDGYIIGKKIKMIDAGKMRLSTILRSYYSFPHARSGNNNLATSYCDRQTEKPQINDLYASADLYGEILKGSGIPGDSKTQLISNALDKAVQTQDICRRQPTTNLDDNSPCETPSDLIFVVDPKAEKLNDSIKITNDIIGKVNKIGKYAGTISVFLNSNQKTDVELPGGSNGWPFAALLYNATNIGSVPCSFKRDNFNFQTQTNFGKFFKQLNQTVLNYKWWTPRRFYSSTASKNFIIIDYDSLKLPTDSNDINDFNYYKNELNSGYNRDIQYLIISKNKKNFEDILKKVDNKNDNKDKYMVDPQSSQIGASFEKIICDNPATFIYNDCYEKASEGFTSHLFISPGYKQNWAMYPEHFLKSFDIEFKIAAHDGTIRYCFDRTFPPKDPDQCKDVTTGGNEVITITNPCKGKDMDSCDPFFFTFWGKERKDTTPCKDVACQSLDQIAFSISHKGVACSSSLKLGAIFLVQLICFSLTMFYYNH